MSATLLIDVLVAFRVESVSVEGGLPWVDVRVGRVVAGRPNLKMIVIDGVTLSFRENDPHLRGQREVRGKHNEAF